VGSHSICQRSYSHLQHHSILNFHQHQQSRRGPGICKYIQYVDGSGVSGTFGTDVFVIESSLINITTTYLWVTDMVDLSYPNGVQGLVGMGNTQIPNFLDVAYQKGEIQTPVFAL